MRVLGTSTLIVLAALATGCGTDEAKGPGPQPTASSPATAWPTDLSSTSTEDGLTAPGSRLAVGETATVPLGNSTDSSLGRAELSVSGIEPIAAQDLVGVDEADGKDAYLIRGTLEVIELADDFSSDQPSINLNGSSRGAVVRRITSETPPGFDCPPADLGRQAAVGDTVDLCVTALVDPGAPIEANWSVPGSDYAFGTGQPVFWLPQ